MNPLWHAARDAAMTDFVHIRRLTFLLAVLASTPVLAKVNDPEAYKAKVEDGIRESTKASVESYFAQSGLEQPELIDVTVNANLDFEQAEPRLEEATVSVTMTTEHLPPVIREARQQVARSLAAQGFRFSADNDDQRPLVTLKVGVIAPAHLAAEGRAFREYATLIALFLGFLATLVLAFYVFIRPFRRRKHKRPAQQPAQIFTHPPVETPELILPEPELELPPGPIDFKLLAKASVAVVRRTFDQLPFDKAFAMLAEADVETRTQVIDKLQLQPAVRERLERELSHAHT